MAIQNPATGSAQSAQGMQTNGAPVRTAKNTLDQQAFLQILVSKLQNQDPMAPMEDQDFIAQMAQFSALEQMQSLNAGFGFAQAASLVGRHVQATIPAESGGVEAVYGLVTQAMTRNGVPTLIVEGREVPYSSSLAVYMPDPAASPAMPVQEA